MKDFNAHEYWERRHIDQKNSLSSVGVQSASESCNIYAYRNLANQYSIVLDKLHLGYQSKVLDAGCGIGYFTSFLKQRGFDVTAVDVSQAALNQLDIPPSQKICAPIVDIQLDRQFDLVHCFDVLYHITDNAEWAKSLEILAKASRKYVVLHERFFKSAPLLSAKHIRIHTYQEQTLILNRLGYKEVMSMPSHIFAKRLLTYRISNYAPRFMHGIDQILLNRLGPKWKGRLGSHHIKVFERHLP